MENITGKSKDRRARGRSRRGRCLSNVSEILGMSPTERRGEEDMVTVTAFQHVRAVIIHRHGNTPRPMSRMSWYVSQTHLVSSPHTIAMDWTLEVDEVTIDSDADDEYDEYFVQDVLVRGERGNVRC